jgi:hypothetical protein
MCCCDKIPDKNNLGSKDYKVLGSTDCGSVVRQNIMTSGTDGRGYSVHRRQEGWRWGGRKESVKEEGREGGPRTRYSPQGLIPSYLLLSVMPHLLKFEDSPKNCTINWEPTL